MKNISIGIRAIAPVIPGVNAWVSKLLGGKDLTSEWSPTKKNELAGTVLGTGMEDTAPKM